MARDRFQLFYIFKPCVIFFIICAVLIQISGLFKDVFYQTERWLFFYIGFKFIIGAFEQIPFPFSYFKDALSGNLIKWIDEQSQIREYVLYFSPFIEPNAAN